MNTTKLLRIVLVTASLLLIPLVGMRFSPDIKWSVFDFTAAAVLLIGTGLAYELVASRVQAGNPWHKLAVASAVGTGLLLIWVNVAVGVIGTENNPANLMYLGVLAVAIIGAILGRFEPRGMARAMTATAVAQAVVAVITLFGGFVSGFELTKASGVNGMFIVLWAGSALLFRNVSETEQAS